MRAILHAPAMIRLLIALSLLSCAPSCWAQDGPAGNAARGKAVYLEMGCYACHGTTGAGGGTAGPQLAPAPAAFAGLFLQLRKPAQRMPAYGAKLLSDRQAADIYAYLKSVPKGRTASSIAILNR
jgi:mono/diheme cytochrome c family protein